MRGRPWLPHRIAGASAAKYYSFGFLPLIPILCNAGVWIVREKRRDESRRGRHECLRHVTMLESSRRDKQVSICRMNPLADAIFCPPPAPPLLPPPSSPAT